MMHGVLLLPADAERDVWLAERRTGIGASEIAVVLGISPWDSPFSLYWRKQLGSETVMNEAMEWGLRHESTIADKFAETHPEFVVEPGGLFRHPQHAWMLATPDRILYPTKPGQTGACLQIKTGYSLDEWGEPGTDEVPLHYRAQVMQEMAVTGLKVCHIAVLVRGNTYREYVVEFDEQDAETMRAAGETFMKRLAACDPPDIDGSPATTATLKALHASVIDESVDVPETLADKWRETKRALDVAQAAHDEATNQMRAAVGGFRYGVAGGRKVATRSVYETRRVAGKRLKAEMPDVYADYSDISLTDKLIPAQEALA